MLSKKDFKSADKETLRIMLWVARREEEGCLDFNDINKFPCRDLCTIDQLWLASSNGKFGFSVQKRIWIECGGELEESDYNSNSITWTKFSERVEWEVGDKCVSYDELCWDLRAVDGHLPMAPRPMVSFINIVSYSIFSDIGRLANTLGNLMKKETTEKEKSNKDNKNLFTYTKVMYPIFIMPLFFSRAATCKL